MKFTQGALLAFALDASTPEELGTHAERHRIYHRADYRIKCARCGRWMRRNPTPKTPATRRPAPDAGRCTECPTKGQDT